MRELELRLKSHACIESGPTSEPSPHPHSQSFLKEIWGDEHGPEDLISLFKT